MMVKFKLGIPVIATVQKVGNKSREEGIAFASKADDMSFASEFVSTLVKNTFKFDTFSQFDSIDSLDMNPSYRFVRKIFENKDEFVKQSNNLARHLYDQSIHPHISNGEFYVIYIDVSYENGEYSIKSQLGLSTKHLDKGCIIFNTQSDNGYLISIVETSTIRQDGRYWSNNFLYIKEIITDFQHTEHIADFCSTVVRQISKGNPEKSLDLVKASRKIIQILQNEGREVNTNELISSLAIDEEVASMLLSYKREYEERSGEMPETFKIAQNAAKRKAITKANILKIGSGFELKVLDSSAIIEQGYDDEKKQKYIPYVIEPSLGADRVTLAFLCAAYDEENIGTEEKPDIRTVLHFHPQLAPVKIGVLPLSKKLNEGAEKIYAELSKYYNCEFDDRGNIGKRYRRQDEIGTPFCVTYDFDSVEDGAVTVRDRDTMEQERVKIEDLKAYFEKKFEY